MVFTTNLKAISTQPRMQSTAEARINWSRTLSAFTSSTRRVLYEPRKCVLGSMSGMMASWWQVIDWWWTYVLGVNQSAGCMASYPEFIFDQGFYIAIRSLLRQYAQSLVNVIIVYYTDVCNIIFSKVTYAILHKHNYSTYWLCIYDNHQNTNIVTINYVTCKALCRTKLLPVTHVLVDTRMLTVKAIYQF